MCTDEVLDSLTKWDMFTIIEEMSDAFFALDTDWRFTHVNEQACQLLQRERNVLIGKYIWEAFPNTDAFEAHYRRAVQEKIYAQFEAFYDPLATWFEVRAYPSSQGLNVYFKDITTNKRLEEEIRQTRRVQELGEMGIWEWDLTRDEIHWSDAARKIGHQPRSRGTFDWYINHLVLEKDQPLVRSAIERALRGAPYDVEYRIVRPSGDSRMIHSQGQVIFNQNGKAIRMIGVAHDITSKRETERLLFETRERYRLIAEHSQDIISYCTPDFVFEYVSPAVNRLLGFDAEELIGQPPSVLYHPDEVPFMKANGQRLLQGEQIERFESRIRHKNGTYLWFETSIQTIQNARGDIVRILAIGRDITERKQAELYLVESEERYRVLVETALDAIALTDGVQWLYMNDAGWKMFGASSRDEMIGREIYEFLQPHYHAMCKERIMRIVENGDIPDVVEQQWCMCDGRLIDAEVRTVPVKFADATLIQFVIRDISERRRSEQLMIQSEKLSAIGQLAAGVAHEIRNPLTALKGFLQLLQATKQPYNEQYFDIMREELSRIETICGEMLMLSKPPVTAFEMADISVILQSVVTLLDTQAVMKNIEITMDCHATSAIVCARDQIKQVFLNLIKNAIEAMPDGGRIQIRLHELEHSIIIQIEDDGQGIDAEMLSKLGDPFVTTKESGTGLGLTVTRKIIDNHGGEIHFSSELGVGTTATVKLPTV